MQKTFESIHDDVEAGIWDGRYEIDESRNVLLIQPRSIIVVQIGRES